MIHEDDRRILTSIPYKDGEIKIIVTKNDCILGNHYHSIKTEEFRLIEGKGDITVESFNEDMILGESHVVYPNESHSFNLQKDSVLVCVCSHPYDKNDDYEAT